MLHLYGNIEKNFNTTLIKNKTHDSDDLIYEDKNQFKYFVNIVPAFKDI